MKKLYVAPAMEMEVFETSDVITASWFNTVIITDNGNGLDQNYIIDASDDSLYERI